MINAAVQDSTNLETRVAQVGAQLVRRITRILESVPNRPQGPVHLGKALGIDKVLASRILKAAGNKDPIAALQMMPGPAPLRRMLRAAAKRGVPAPVVNEAEQAVFAFDELIRREAGDRSALDAMLSAWLPEARAEFELRRKQAAFRAMSQLRGVQAELNLATVLLHPSSDPTQLDVVWLFGLLGLQRLRPGCAVKFASRRVAGDAAPRQPHTLDGVPVEGLDGLRLDEFCSSPPAELDVQRVGDVMHYSLARNGFGPHSATDLIFAEVNRAELARHLPPGQSRKRQVFAEISTPVKTLLFDALLHEEVFNNADPTLYIYDTAFEGVADVNDPARNIDRLDLRETIQPLGRGIDKFRVAEAPRYAELLRLVCDKLRWNGSLFRGYRCRIEYPIYGSQIVMAFQTA